MTIDGADGRAVAIGRPQEAEPARGLDLHLVPGTPARLVAGGEIDVANGARFERSVAAACESAENLVIDLTGVDFISSAGIGTLYRHCDRLAAVLVAEPSLIHRALGYAGFTRLVPVIPTG